MFSDAGAGLDRLPSRARGLTNKEIGALVDLSAHTIKDLLEKIAAAFDVPSRGGRRRSVPRGPHLGLVIASAPRSGVGAPAASPPRRLHARAATPTNGRRKFPLAPVGAARAVQYYFVQ